MPSLDWYLKNFSILALAALLCLEFSGSHQGFHLVAPAVLLGQLVVVAGGGIELGHYAALRRENKRIAEPTTLEMTRGLYKFVRHPMYFGDLLILVGFSIMMATPTALALGCLGLFGIARQVRIEDEELLKHFGERAKQWQQTTRAVIPFVW